MSEIVKVVLEAREGKGKEACSKLRPAGYVPCVVYGPDYPESVAAKVKLSDISKVVASGHWETQTMLLTLPGGKEEMGIMREVQKDILNGKILHVDFMQLVQGHKITVNVPVELIGRDVCAGVKLGGVIDHLLHEISMEVLPGQIPDSVAVDVSSMKLGAQVHVKDIAVPQGASVLSDPDEVVVTVMIPRGISEAEETGEEQKEVEVVGKGKGKDEEE
ncbi:50S ribosomal protein L25 [Aminivibrio sp.]|uniref:50S ribosomal protein L25 n=1 Tax=Aminivibrio sp. TaxID=1872489 RepID=UPI001A568EBC|nr:50S ribosomal protein L25 [Aminivibrio sp.]MBL3538324.1 50S ribosomal protein L25 [Aminivibrio sp.]